MNIFGKTIMILAAAAALISCKQDETLMYNNMTMGNVIDGTFVSDQGNIFNIVERNTIKNIEGMNRVLTICDILKKVEGTENVYDVRLNAVTEVFTKKHILLEYADASKDESVNDPVYIQDLWISGGYINMYIMLEMKFGSDQKHMINLVYDEKASGDGKYIFQLRHNAYGESLVYDATGIGYGGTYVSFPISDTIKDNSAELIISSRWYKSEGYGWSSEVIDYSYDRTYTKGGFEQVPASAQGKSTTKVN